MNNLKRVLSLGLASISLIGTMAVGASAADFPDRDKIEHKEAVDVLTALGIIQGKGDGTFAPEEKVTRGQMAKMIYVAVARDNTDPGTTSAHPFTDTRNDWSAGYVEACYNMGIIAGRGDGTFDPNGVVTTTEVAKMVLVALGYDADAYKLTGAEWSTRTQKFARNAKPQLFDEVSSSVVLNAPATRDVAAQIIWNGLQNKIKTTEAEVNDATGVTDKYVSGEDTLLYKTFKGHIAQGTFSGNYYFNKGSAEKKNDINVTDAVQKDKNDAQLQDFTIRLQDDQKLDIANVGEQIRVIWKDGGDGNTKNVPDKYDHVYGVFLTGATQGVKSTRSKVKDNKNTDKVINIDGTTHELADEVTVWTNYRTKSAYSGAQLVGGTSTNSKLTSVLKKNDGATLKTVTDPVTGKINTIYVVESDLAVVTAASSSQITLNDGYGKINVADNDVEEGLQKDDVVVVTVLYKTKATDTDAYVIVKKAEKVSGKVTGYEEKDNGTTAIYVDGTKHKVMDASDEQKGQAMKTLGLKDAVTKITDNEKQENFDLYKVNGFVRAAAQTSETVNYSVIVGVQEGTVDAAFDTGRLKIKVMDSDETQRELRISKKSDVIDDLTADSVGAIVTYTVDKDGDARIKTYVGPESKTMAYIDNNNTLTVGGAGKATTTSSVLFYTNGDDDWKAMKLQDSSSKDYGTHPVAVKTNDDGEVVAVAVRYGGSVGQKASNAVYAIITSDVSKLTDSNDHDCYGYTVAVGDESFEIKHAVSRETTPLKKGTIITFNRNAKDEYEKNDVKVLGKTGAQGCDDLTATVGYVSKYEGGTNVVVASAVTYDAEKGQYVAPETTTYAIDKDAKVYVVDKDGKKGVDAGSLADMKNYIGAFDPSTPYANIIVLSEKKSSSAGVYYVVKALVVENSGKADIATPDNAVTVKLYRSGSSEADTLAIGCADDYGDGYAVNNTIRFEITGADSAKVAGHGTYTSGQTLTLREGINDFTLTVTKNGNTYIYKVTFEVK